MYWSGNILNTLEKILKFSPASFYFHSVVIRKFKIMHATHTVFLLHYISIGQH